MDNVQRMHELMKKHTKAELLRMAFAGGLLDFNNPAQWRKDEIAATVAEQEERRTDRVAPLPVPSRIDVSKPYQYRVNRADGVKEWSFSHGSFDGTTEQTTAAGVAQEAAAGTRVGHSYYGPLTVYVWQRSGEDGTHYRDPVPAGAERFDFPAQPLLDPKYRADVARLEQRG